MAVHQALLLLGLTLLAAGPCTVAAKNGITAASLVGGATPRQGYLQLSVGKTRYTGFCQTGDGDMDYTHDIAQVVCRQLGFGRGQFYDKFDNRTAASKPYNGWLQCKGTEKSLADCTLKASTTETCTNLDPESDRGPYFFGVVCDKALTLTKSDLRLVGGTVAGEGRVEVKVGKKAWGSMCLSADASPNQMAKLVCSTMGFKGPALYRSDGYFKDTPAAVEVLDCPDSATSSLNQCNMAASPKPGEYCFSPSFGVSCQTGSKAITGVRLKGTSKTSGHVEVQGADKKWVGVCLTSSDEVDPNAAANVACKQLGFKSGTAVDGGDATKGSAVADINCPSTAASLSACSFAGTSAAGYYGCYKNFAIKCQ